MRAATSARLVVGSACLVVPRRVLGAVGGPDRDDARVRGITRVLGVRLVVQAGLDLAWGRRTRDLDVVVELTHAASMVAGAVIWPAHRRSASASAALAAGIAALDLADPTTRSWPCWTSGPSSSSSTRPRCSRSR